MLSTSMKSLLQNADLDIIDHSIHNRQEMQQNHRVFPFYVMSYIKSGDACLRVQDQVYRIGPGSIILVPPNIPHDHFKDTSTETIFMWWHFHFRIAGMVDLIKFLQLPIVSKLSNQEKFEEIFLRYASLDNHQETIPMILMQRAFSYEVLSVIFEELLTNEAAIENAQIPAIFLDIFQDIADLTNTQITLDDLSRQYHLNATYISNRFKKYFDISPIALRRRLVVQQAKMLLRDQSRCVGDIALELGFEDLGTFSRFFSSHTGTSPQQYRKSYPPGTKID